MSDKKERTVQDVQNEYQNLCMKAGDVQYKIFALNEDLSLMNATLRELNIEASKLYAEERAKQEAAAAEAPKADEATPGAA